MRNLIFRFHFWFCTRKSAVNTKKYQISNKGQNIRSSQEALVIFVTKVRFICSLNRLLIESIFIFC